MIQRVSLRDAAVQPWKNGGGLTRELLVWPPVNDWQIRISVAEIERDGPFSEFVGIERWFVVLSGAGVALTLPEGTHILKPGDTPICFEGEAAPVCRLINGPTADLNFMRRRGDSNGCMRVAQVYAPWVSSATWRGVYTTEDCHLQIGGEAFELEAHCLAWADHAKPVAWALSAGDRQLRAWWLDFGSQGSSA